MRNRSVGAHNMNDHSSRSHSILTVSITSEQQVSTPISLSRTKQVNKVANALHRQMDSSVFISKQGKINFVDLAGSEMTKKTQSEGKTLEEANNINKSLMVLGKIVPVSVPPHRLHNIRKVHRVSLTAALCYGNIAQSRITSDVTTRKVYAFNYSGVSRRSIVSDVH